MPSYPTDTIGICSIHWKATDARRRRMHRRIGKLRDTDPLRFDKLQGTYDRNWHELERQAIEAGMGIG